MKQLELPREYQTFIFCPERCSDDFRKWPEKYRELSDTAIERLLKENPGMKVTAEEAFCITEENSIFPDKRPPMTNGQTEWFGLVRRVQLGPIQHDS